MKKTDKWLLVLLVVGGLWAAEGGVRTIHNSQRLTKERTEPEDYADIENDSGETLREDHEGVVLTDGGGGLGGTMLADSGAKSAESSWKNLINVNSEDYKSGFLMQSKKEALRKKAQDQRNKTPLRPDEVIISIFRRMLEPFEKEDCLEMILCQVGKAASHVMMLRVGLGMMTPHVPEAYYVYATALLNGLDNRCPYHCTLLHPRDEL
ncbi:uncharacterized protein [Cherax quadricarinatus]|uniref:uncharacterized protein n=1 Tax=Cherax quadricarinatus TaxID=27406 RepID=UPI0023784A5A|nr:uncharacterized protein LOC128696293 [Cherax quadricarinatus]